MMYQCVVTSKGSEYNLIQELVWMHVSHQYVMVVCHWYSQLAFSMCWWMTLT